MAAPMLIMAAVSSAIKAVAGLGAAEGQIKSLWDQYTEDLVAFEENKRIHQENMQIMETQKKVFYGGQMSSAAGSNVSVNSENTLYAMADTLKKFGQKAADMEYQLFAATRNMSLRREKMIELVTNVRTAAHINALTMMGESAYKISQAMPGTEGTVEKDTVTNPAYDADFANRQQNLMYEREDQMQGLYNLSEGAFERRFGFGVDQFQMYKNPNPAYNLK